MLEAVKNGANQDFINQNGTKIPRDNLYNKYIALLGIGHTIAKIGTDGELKFITDGHASKLCIQVDSEDLPLLKVTKQRMEQISGKEEIVMLDNNKVRAEDLFRGPVINALANVNNGQDINLKLESHNQALRLAGKYMARTIALIKSGKSET
ncbi:MAG: hypothetical protein RCG15_08555 [Candidatus Rickettsia vulgarisii]